MKNILIVMHGLDCGGAEKSLISFLERIPLNQWNIDLIVANPHGMLMDKIPEGIHVLQGMYALENYATPLNKRNKKICGFRDFFSQTVWHIGYPIIRKVTDLSFGEIRWKLWGKFLPKLEKEYDLAISYMNGFPNYYVMEKVSAKKKVLWVHNEFEKLGYSYEFERPYYNQADAIVTISKSCRDNILKIYPQLEEKVSVLENISSAKTIRKMSDLKTDDPYFHTNKRKIVSVGRLMEQKNFALAISAASVLKEKGINFLWYILGEGELRADLQEQINELGLSGYVKLVGLKENPYPYISDCDVFVQSSLYEGKSIVLDEAKILEKPIVITNYTTAANSITDGVNGLISEMNADSLAQNISEVLEDAVLSQRLSNQLREEKCGNDEEINKYLNLIQTMLE